MCGCVCVPRDRDREGGGQLRQTCPFWWSTSPYTVPMTELPLPQDKGKGRTKRQFWFFPGLLISKWLPANRPGPWNTLVTSKAKLRKGRVTELLPNKHNGKLMVGINRSGVIQHVTHGKDANQFFETLYCHNLRIKMLCLSPANTCINIVWNHLPAGVWREGRVVGSALIRGQREQFYVSFFPLIHLLLSWKKQ